MSVCNCHGARRAFLAGKLFLREVLSHYSDRPADSWEFVENEYGKPALKAGPENLAFNLSHSRQGYMLALSRHGCTGADIEFSARSRRVRRLAGRYFSRPECDWLLGLSEADQQDGFYCLWTLKEATIKARGMGLALPLDSFSFDLAALRPLLSRARTGPGLRTALAILASGIAPACSAARDGRGLSCCGGGSRAGTGVNCQ